jgi:polyferredoxin
MLRNYARPTDARETDPARLATGRGTGGWPSDENYLTSELGGQGWISWVCVYTSLRRLFEKWGSGRQVPPPPRRAALKRSKRC